MFPGADIVYTITVVNAGPSAAAPVSLIDFLPPATTFVSLSSPGGWLCTTPAVGAGGTVSCSIASLGIGNAVFTLTANVAAATANGTVISNTATVSSATPDPTPSQSDTETTTVATGLAYYTQAPCRVVDTRAAAPLGSGEIRSFDVTGGPCLVPDAARAVVVNVTAVNPAAQGNLLAFKGGTPPPGAGLIVQMRPGLTRGGHGIVGLADDGSGLMSVRNTSAGTAHVIIDVVGYFLP